MSWDECAANWDEDPAVRAYADAAFGSLQDFLTAQGRRLQGARVLDFGCGTGQLSEKLAAAGAEVVAVDASEKMIEVLVRKVAERGLARIRPLAAVVDDTLIEAEDPFDLVVCSSVCAFLEDYPATAALLARGLGSGGLFVQWDWALDPEADEPFGLSAEQIRGALEGAGLEVLRAETGFEVAFEAQTMAPLMGVGRRA